MSSTIYLSLVPGDATGDLNVDLDDFVVLKQNFNSGTLPAQGDADGDGDVDLDDFVLLKANWGAAKNRPIIGNPTGSGVYVVPVQPLFADGATPTDVKQGKVGDCYYLAALASVAVVDPDRFPHLIAELGDGTFLTRYTYVSGEVAIARLTMEVAVNTSGGTIYAGIRGDTWVALMEKAFAHFRYGADSYESIDAGWPDGVYRALGLDSHSDWTWNYPDLPQYLADCLEAGQAVTLVSQTTNVGPIVANHVYAVTDVVRDAGGVITGVQLYNPWGSYLEITNAQLLAGFRLVTAVQA